MKRLSRHSPKVRGRVGLTADVRLRLKELERENRQLRRTNDLLRKAAAFFMQAAIDRRSKGY